MSDFTFDVLPRRSCCLWLRQSLSTVASSCLCCWMIFFRALSRSCCCFCRNSCSWTKNDKWHKNHFGVFRMSSLCVRRHPTSAKMTHLWIHWAVQTSGARDHESVVVGSTALCQVHLGPIRACADEPDSKDCLTFSVTLIRPTSLNYQRDQTWWRGAQRLALNSYDPSVITSANYHRGCF